MTVLPSTTWPDTNQRCLSTAVATVRRCLELCINRSGELSETDSKTELSPQVVACAGATVSSPSALEALCDLFGLSPFERDLLVLCAAVELDSSFPLLCAAAQGDDGKPYPTFSLGLAALPEPHWSALAPSSPLRRWLLIEVEPGRSLTQSPLRIDERILHHLTGVQHPDERLDGLLQIVHPESPPDIVPSHQLAIHRLSDLWVLTPRTSILPAVQLCGEEATGKWDIAAATACSLGLKVCVVRAHFIPTAPGDLDLFLRLCERETALESAAVFLDCDTLAPGDPLRDEVINYFVGMFRGPLIISSREGMKLDRQTVRFEIGRPTNAEQILLWNAAIGPNGDSGIAEALVSQFNLPARTIRFCAMQSGGRSGDNDEGQNEGIHEDLVWESCRRQTRHGLSHLAQRIEPSVCWDDLVLPDSQRRILRDILAHVRQRATVYETWGFGRTGSRGLGISALFVGSSGTGKTMAADVLANELSLDLYRIDLSQVVSKYIGETEKNLGQVFSSAEESGAILLFDEADALFGKRGEVKDSHDRYANIEVSYLLQRMEAFRGLAILTTNLKDVLDPAFLRRIRFVVQFPFPDAAQREEIWLRIFPSDTPIDGIDFRRLARLTVSGGSIKNIALYSAFLAADAGEPVRMGHLRRAAQVEYAKLERPLTEAEIGGWV